MNTPTSKEMINSTFDILLNNLEKLSRYEKFKLKLKNWYFFNILNRFCRFNNWVHKRKFLKETTCVYCIHFIPLFLTVDRGDCMIDFEIVKNWNKCDKFEKKI